MYSLLDFESDLEPIEAEIESLRRADDTGGDGVARLRELEKKRAAALKKIYAKLTDWQVCQVARHVDRPQTADYIRVLCSDFMELHGDRTFANDRAIIAGLGTFNGQSVAIVGQQKGRGTAERIERNFGMAEPEGYRKALRIMALAEKFRLPLLSFVDTPGAYPGMGAEERGQSGAIGECLRRAATLKTPMLVVVVGEGGSGGALAIAVGDYVSMLRYAVYSVISPEGCASILWKDSARMTEAAELLGLTADNLKKLRLIDEVIDEPPGGAHRHMEQSIKNVGEALATSLERLKKLDTAALLKARHRRWRDYGKFSEARK